MSKIPDMPNSNLGRTLAHGSLSLLLSGQEIARFLQKDSCPDFKYYCPITVC
jgi:hypothetical protein